MKRLLFLLSIILLFSTPVQSRTITGFDTNQDFRLVQVEAGIYSPGISLYPKEKVLGASISLPVQGGTGIGSATTFDIGSVLTVSSSNPFQYKFVATSSLGISVSETDPIFGAWLLNPILTSLTTTNFFATNTLFLNATTTNLGVNNIFSFGVPTFVIKTDAGDNTGNMEIRLGVNENGELNLFGGLYLNNGLSSPNPSGRASLVTLPLTASREITFQDKDGVFAYTNDNISEFTNDIGYITNAEETDPIWTAFLADPIFTNLTSTNFFATNTQFVNATTTNLNFTNASGTSITTTNAQFDKVNVGSGSIGSAYVKITTAPFAPDAFIITDNASFTYDCGRDSFYGGAYCGGLAGSALSLWANGSMVIRLTTGGDVGINTSSPIAKLAVDGTLYITQTSTFAGALIFSTASGTSITSTNAFFQNLSFTNATGTNITSTKIYASSVVSIGTTSQLYPLNVGGKMQAQYYYMTDNPAVFFSSDTGGLVVNGGYLYAAGAGTGLYVQNSASFRGSILRDNGATLSITGGTSGYTNITSRLGVNSSTPNYNLSIVGDAYITATTTMATSTVLGGFFQTGLGDCELDTQTVNYDLTTGKFSCLTDDTGSGSGVNNVGTSTANYFTFYTSSTAVTGTPWVTFANGALTVTTNTSFTIISSTNALFTNATTTNLYTTNLNINGTVLDTSALLSYAEKNYLTCDTGYFEGGLVYTDDVCQVRSTNLVWNYSESPMRLYVNGLGEFTQGISSTTGVFTTSVSSTDGTFTGNMTVGNDLTVGGDLTLGGSLSLGGLTVGSTTISATNGITSNNAILNYIRPVEGSTLSKPLADREQFPMGTAVANTYAFYSDDNTRWLVCSNVAGTGAISLKNTNLTPANTGQAAQYSSAGVLQTITAATLFGAGYAVRSCFTSNGYNYVLAVSTTAATNKVWLKAVTSSYAVNLAATSTWRTVNWTVDTPSTSIISIAGVTRQSGVDKIIIVSSSTRLIPATFTVDASTSTITPDNSIGCTTGGSHTIGNTRALQFGYVVGNSSAPFETLYNTSCGATTYNGSWGQAAPASTGPDLAVTKCSIYSLQSTNLYRWEGYSGC